MHERSVYLATSRLTPMNSVLQISLFHKPASKVAKWFIISAGLILLITAAAKLYSAGGTAPILASQEPIFEIPSRYLILIAASAELMVGAICLMPRLRLLAVRLVAWLATMFAVYRVGLWLVDYRPCSCLGALTDALHLSRNGADIIALMLLTYLFGGSYLLLFSEFLTERRR